MGVRKILECRIEPQARDVLLFKRLCDFGFLSTNQIADFIFCTPRTSASDRLVKLRKAGYVESAPRGTAAGAAIYTPVISSLVGLIDSKLVARGRKSTTAQLWRRSHLDHEETSREIALRILSMYPHIEIDLDHLLFQSDWEGDYRESSSSKKVPDFVVKGESRTLGVFEIELNQKSKLRYFKIFNRLIRNSRSPIIYICKDEQIATVVKENYALVEHHLLGTEDLKVPKIIVRLLDEVTHREGLAKLLEELFSEQKGR